MAYSYDGFDVRTIVSLLDIHPKKYVCLHTRAVAKLRTIFDVAAYIALKNCHADTQPSSAWGGEFGSGSVAADQHRSPRCLTSSRPEVPLSGSIA